MSVQATSLVLSENRSKRLRKSLAKVWCLALNAPVFDAVRAAASAFALALFAAFAVALFAAFAAFAVALAAAFAALAAGLPDWAPCAEASDAGRPPYQAVTRDA